MFKKLTSMTVLVKLPQTLRSPPANSVLKPVFQRSVVARLTEKKGSGNLMIILKTSL
jgi:hypothetical protein